MEVIDPVTAAHYHLHLEYLRTETAGPLFENMKARLAAIASHSGMSKVFRLLGSDVYRVQRIDAVPGGEEPQSRRGPLCCRACARTWRNRRLPPTSRTSSTVRSKDWSATATSAIPCC